MEDIKEKKEVLIGSRVFLTDSRKNMAEVMGFGCHEATLRFEPGSEMKATMFWEPLNMLQFLTKVHFITSSLFNVFLFLLPIHC
ncbi:hypothetical protein ARALYDRAFT_894797 [Arabidopsis lyrata subsp. lyrata]|uniref:Uncharacterized protein n=1 Tax=Arabidopsis lyrata subsp. lyrata TaxID=81972 RepID=D7KXM4_ARALL|nr:hypothetical protein ARALYDRAFT_894797 [Arabidopsis lyrata subsp. lyrata]